MRRILVADDAAHVRELAREILEPEGFELFEARDGEEAVAVFELSRPDLVLLDLVMPVRSGLEVLGAIRDCDDAVPVVVLSGLGQEILAAEAVVSGASDCLTKPLHPIRLLTTLRRCQRKRLTPAA